MIHNPPNIVDILRAPSPDAVELAALLIRHIGHQPWDAFLRTYHLYLQSISFDLAKEAWGINAALASAATHKTKHSR